MTLNGWADKLLDPATELTVMTVGNPVDGVVDDINGDVNGEYALMSLLWHDSVTGKKTGAQLLWRYDGGSSSI